MILFCQKQNMYTIITYKLVKAFENIFQTIIELSHVQCMLKIVICPSIGFTNNGICNQDNATLWNWENYQASKDIKDKWLRLIDIHTLSHTEKKQIHLFLVILRMGSFNVNQLNVIIIYQKPHIIQRPLKLKYPATYINFELSVLVCT